MAKAPAKKTVAEEQARLKEVHSKVSQRIAVARTDRNKFAGRINAIYALGLPDRQRINEATDARNPDEQDEIFDEILQTTIDDFVSDMIDLFTPKYRPWTKFSASIKAGASNAAISQFQKELRGYSDHIFQAIKDSNFYAVGQEAWADIACAVGAIIVPFARAGERVTCQHVLNAELLIEEGPDGLPDGRWRERKSAVRYLSAIWPDVDWTEIKKKFQKDDKIIAVTEGCYRDWEAKGDETWIWHVIADGKIVHEQVFTGEGSCPFIVARWRRAAPSAWGMGPASPGLPPTRTLQRLAHDIMVAISKMADPPHSYEEDGVFNAEQGVDAGTFIPRMPGSKAPEPLFRSMSVNEMYFEQEDLRQRVKRVLFQDKPVQRGDTPPTLGQWLDERTNNNRRLENPRDRIVTEWVLPILKRFAWIEQERGLLPQVKLEGELVNIEIQSPLSKASDLEDVNVASQVLQIAQGFMPQEIPLAVNGRATLAKIKAKLGDDLVELMTEEEYEGAKQAAVAAQMGSPGAA